MNDNKVHTKISELSDSDFISFLYAERDRENSLCQYQGWNNWALIAAFITVVCTGYAVLKESDEIYWKDVLYFSSGMVIYFLLYHSWWRLLKPKRGVDFSKVRMLIEVAPLVKIGFIFVCAIAAAIIIPIIDGYNAIFWGWIIVVLTYSIALMFIIIFRNKLVPSYFEELFLPWIWVDLIFTLFATAVLVNVGQNSFKMTISDIFSSEFVVSACISACLILIFVLIKINASNKSVRRFEKILDNYLYLDVSKEDTFKEIMINRMGYGVFDACSKEFNKVNELMQRHGNEVKKLDELKELIVKEQFASNQIDSFQRLANNIIDNQYSILQLSLKLSNRIGEILKVVPYIENIPEIKFIIETNNANCIKIQTTITQIKSMIDGIKAIIQKSIEKEKDKKNTT